MDRSSHKGDRQSARRLSIDAMLTRARASLQRLGPFEALEAQREGALLIDTRSDELRSIDGSIPGALHVPLSELEWRVDPDSPWRDERVGGLDTRLVIVCAHGYSSSLAAARLQQLGFHQATDVIGGFEAWVARGLPVMEGEREET
jgi:rhodanese-related sulfurtransferase